MGCSICKQNKEQTTEEILIKSFEDSLGFCKLQSLIIDRVLHRYSSNEGMSLSQLEKAFSDLKLDISSFHQFLSFFYDQYSYSLKKLKCLGILLGEETIPKKLKILFQTYDQDMSGSLNRAELTELIDHITEVACVIIPKGALLAQPNNGNLKIYVEGIVNVRRSLMRQLISAIIEMRESISEREFNVSYQNDEGVRNILSSQALRQYCHYLKTNVLGSVENIIKNLSSNEQARKILNYRLSCKKIVMPDTEIQ